MSIFANFIKFWSTQKSLHFFFLEKKGVGGENFERI
jgi:hypothetical protein